MLDSEENILSVRIEIILLKSLKLGGKYMWMSKRGCVCWNSIKNVCMLKREVKEYKVG